MNNKNKQNIFQHASFLLSAPTLAALPTDTGKELAIVGRSNSGKSTLINIITQQKKLARVGKTPGVTQMLNVFVAAADSEKRLIDLPGYGFAKAPPAARHTWQELIWQYLRNRKSLVGLLLLMDVRHPVNTTDREILELAITQNLATHIVLTKADKLKRAELHNTFQKITALIKPYENLISTQLFSAITKLGITELQNKLHELID